MTITVNYLFDEFGADLTSNMVVETRGQQYSHTSPYKVSEFYLINVNSKEKDYKGIGCPSYLSFISFGFISVMHKHIIFNYIYVRDIEYIERITSAHS